METLLNGALTGVGIALLCVGGHFLVEGGIHVARRLGVSGLVIGMTVVAYGTSTPELAASVAAAGEHGDMVLGNVIGSNIANVGMVIGIAAMLAALAVGRRTLRREIPIMVGFSALLVGLSVDGAVSRLDGAVLIAILCAFTAYTFWQSRRAKVESEHMGEHAPAKTRPFPVSVGMMGMGVGLLYVGAILTVDNAVAIAESFGIPERIIGITVIAIGTSLPELITSVMAIRKGQTDIGVGNIIGSNIYNILMITGVAAAIAGISVAPAVFTDYTIMILFSVALFTAFGSGRIGRKTGMALTAGYAAYLLSTLAT
ncbi:MAG: calcium/sodium antiporter [Thaumarchaeota archaeon]|nr:calcium/sodium antiporter [Nitrososphaerota archaeon]